MSLKVWRTLGASLALAVGLSALTCLIPDNPYYRYQLLDGSLFEPMLRAYERVHFDARPIDVVVLGSSKPQLGASATRIQQTLAAMGKPANVENFAVSATGRNIEYVLTEEILKTKSPKVIVLDVYHFPFFYGHPAFKYVAPAQEILAQPAPLLHNYAVDLVSLPARQAKLAFADLAPGLSGMHAQFDPAITAARRTDFSTGTFISEGKIINMSLEVPPEKLRKEIVPDQRQTAIDRLLYRRFNDGDDRVYLRQIVELAHAHGVKLIFCSYPNFEEHSPIADAQGLRTYGPILDNGDLADTSRIYENAQHFNHEGAMILSDRLAKAIAPLL
jgi:hypothetical protein